MNFNRKALLTYILVFLVSISGFSQGGSLSSQNLGSVNIDNVSDDEIRTYYDKAVQNGLSDQDIVRLLQERGMPASEISKLTSRLAQMTTNRDQPSLENTITNSTNKSVKNRYLNQDATNVPREKINKDLTVFGSELFTTNSLVFEPNLRIPTPSGYILGPDDELIINVFGYSEKTYNVTVNEEGNIYIPLVGPIFVNGLSIEEASSRIRSKMAATIYKALNNGQTRVQISLGKIRSIRVTVIGEATKPGTYTVSSLTTMFNILYQCGGPSDYGSYRKIELIRSNEVKRIVDLYSFLLKGDQQDNILLREGDVIRIPYYQTRISLNGRVKRSGKFEILEGETFENALKFSGGFADDAYKGNVTVYQLTDLERKVVDLSKDKFKTYQPLSSDSMVVGKLLTSFENKLVIRGAVRRPGEYALTLRLTLKQLISKAGGVNEDVYSKRGSISRLNENKTPVQLSFDIDSIMNDQSNIILRKNDSIYIYSIFDLTNGTSSQVSIDGLINKPGKFQWAENLTLRDVILAAGGLSDAADLSNIEIARRIENINILELNHIQTEIISVDLSERSNTKDIFLRPSDVINIRQRPGFASQRIIYIEGMIVNPGRYTLKMSGDRIADVMKRVGGFRPNADTSAMIIRRLARDKQSPEMRERMFSKLLNIEEDSLNKTESLRNEIFRDYDNISIDLNYALSHPESSENMALEDGDVITIERNTNLVKVSGEVYFPTIVPYKRNENLKYYIEKSGSYTQLARKNGALVIYPDGKAGKVRHFLFFRSYPKVVSRSEIFVPKRSPANRSRITTGELSVILSSLAIIANVIINSQK